MYPGKISDPPVEREQNALERIFSMRMNIPKNNPQNTYSATYYDGFQHRKLMMTEKEFDEKILKKING